MTVAQNIAYPLRLRKTDKAAQARRVAELLELIQLPHMADRLVTQLSGGQRQRVAIARAIASSPRLLLLDEPLSALDAKLREAMQVEIRLLQQRLGITTIMVTHDQREAMTMADEIVVMEKGRIQQVGRPLDIYRDPVNEFVADFIGLGNILPVACDGDDAIVLPGGQRLAIRRAPDTPRATDAVRLLIRPEDVCVRPGEPASAPNTLAGTITFVRDVGASIEATIDCRGFTLPRRRRARRPTSTSACRCSRNCPPMPASSSPPAAPDSLLFSRAVQPSNEDLTMNATSHATRHVQRLLARTVLLCACADARRSRMPTHSTRSRVSCASACSRTTRRSARSART